jgi:hypothetical protein
VTVLGFLRVFIWNLRSLKFIPSRLGKLKLWRLNGTPESYDQTLSISVSATGIQTAIQNGFPSNEGEPVCFELVKGERPLSIVHLVNLHTVFV